MAAGGAVLVLAGLGLSAFAGGGSGGGPAGGGAPTGGASATATVSASAKASCADFDQATARLSGKDDQGFVEQMTAAANAARDAAAGDQQWALLLGHYAAFANDLSANDATAVYQDLADVNEDCAAVRGPRPLVVNNGTGAPATVAPPTTAGR